MRRSMHPSLRNSRCCGASPGRCWRGAKLCGAGPNRLGRIDYSFELDGEGEHSHVAIKQRRRGAPLDLLVAELMIFANSTWGKWLAESRCRGHLSIAGHGARAHVDRTGGA